MLIKICNCILPKNEGATIPPIDGYKASKIGMHLRYPEDLIQNLKSDMKGNEREARRFVIEDAKKNITASIYNAIIQQKLIQFKVSYPKKGEINVRGELKVYVPNE